MYDELIKDLREWPRVCAEYAGSVDELHDRAADAIESTSKAYEMMAEAYEDEVTKNLWIPFETRPMDAEEREYYSEHYGYELSDDEAVIYCCEMPDHDQEVLVCNKYGSVWIDRFDDDPDYGVGFETNGDMDGLVAWMPLPEPYKLPKEGEKDA